MNLKKCFQPLALPLSSSSALLLLRLVVGAAFVIHGWGKMQAGPFGWMGPDAPVPGALQFLAALSEFGGGIAWILGLLVPLASLGIGFTMATAVCTHMFVMKDPFVNLTGGHGYELPLTYFCVAVTLLLMGPGKFSLDAKLFSERLSSER